jgi:hypothetical protein
MTEDESAASNHHIAQVKFLKYKDKIESASDAYDRLSSNDPKVLELLKFGYEQFRINFSKRIYLEHFDQLNLNLCPKCNGIARTPEAKQCRYCKYTWRNE